MGFKRIWHQADVLAASAAGATVVTSGERLARAVRLVHGDAQVASGATVWERPAVFSYTAFMDRLYDSATDAALSAPGQHLPLRLSDAAWESHWETAIRRSPQGAGLLQPAAAAREAARSWDLAVAYRLPLERIAEGDEDAQAFTAWAAEVLAASRSGGWLEDARLMDWLATRVRAASVPVAKQILFIGFDALTPQQSELVESLRAGGSEVRVLEMQAPAGKAKRLTLDDAGAEMRAAAAWARALLERDPAISIGIVVQDLDGCRSAMARALDDALCPAASAGDDIPRPYDLSLGLPLASFPAVHAALAALELLGRRTPFFTVSLLLRSPFLGAADAERDARARLELRLRGRASEEIGLRALTDFAAGASGLPRLQGMLQALREKVASLPARQTPSAWARDFADVLTRAGWPGERALDSDEYQAVTAFQKLTGTLVHLDDALGAVSQGEALARLKRLAAEHIFQPAGADTPVQVLGLQETAGLAFDHLWVRGLTDDRWPAGPRPVPFIPPRLQREYGMPHAGAALELKFARKVTERLLASAPQVLVSTSAAEADAPLRPSPLIAQLPESDGSVTPEVLAYRTRLQHEYPQAAEGHRDMQGPALGTEERTRGGTGLIRSQATCPFQSFAVHRLGAEALEEPALGPDALERGSLMHEVLQTVWEELKGHAGLAALGAAARRDLAERCAARAVAARTRQMPEIYTPRVTALERERLAGHVSAWLEKEAERPPFRVAASETEQSIRIGPLTLQARADRIDELPDGSRVILDYKTGQVNVNAWLEPRPDEPQLPVYALGNPDRLAGLAFACLKPGEMRFAGLAERSGIAAGISAYGERKNRPSDAPDWTALLCYWDANLTLLAEEYAGGDARVSPKDADSCKYCHLSIFCRIHELGGPDEEDGDE